MDVQEGPHGRYAFSFLAYRKVTINGVVVYSENDSDRATVLSQILVGDKALGTLNSSAGIEGFTESVRASLRKSGVFYAVDVRGKAPSRIRMYVFIPIGLLARNTLLASVNKVTQVRTEVLGLFKAFMEPGVKDTPAARLRSIQERGRDRVPG